MPLLREVKEEEEIRKKRNIIRVITWVAIAVALFIIWFVTN